MRGRDLETGGTHNGSNLSAQVSFSPSILRKRFTEAGLQNDTPHPYTDRGYNINRKNVNRYTVGTLSNVTDPMSCYLTLTHIFILFHPLIST
jgi:hypothetical protein